MHEVTASISRTAKKKKRKERKKRKRKRKELQAIEQQPQAIFSTQRAKYASQTSSPTSLLQAPAPYHGLCLQNSGEEFLLYSLSLALQHKKKPKV
jgi:hypothetical protein